MARSSSLVLIACSARKLAHAAPAKELYQGDLFKKQRAWIEKAGHRWAILSAKHGLVQPDDIIEPYEQALKNMTRAENIRWALRTNQQLREAYGNPVILALVGLPYRRALHGFVTHCPTARMGIGLQKQFFGALALR